MDAQVTLNYSEVFTENSTSVEETENSEEIARLIQIIFTDHSWDSWKWFNNLYYEEYIINRCINLFLYVYFSSGRFK